MYGKKKKNSTSFLDILLQYFFLLIARHLSILKCTVKSDCSTSAISSFDIRKPCMFQGNIKHILTHTQPQKMVLPLVYRASDSIISKFQKKRQTAGSLQEACSLTSSTAFWRSVPSCGQSCHLTDSTDQLQELFKPCITP